MTDKINMPKSMSKKFLTQTGLRANPKAVDKFEDELRNFATNLANKTAENTKNAKRQTIYPEDVVTGGDTE